MDTPDQDSEGNYQTTDWKLSANKRTTETKWHKYYDDWYRFSMILTSMVVNEQQHDLPPDFKIDVYVLCRLDGRYIEKVKYAVALMREHSNIKFRGVPLRIDMSGKPHIVEFTDIENADEIYINEKCMDTIEVVKPISQSRHTQSQVEEGSKRFKPGLGTRLKRPWITTIKTARRTIGYIKGSIIRATLICLIIGFLWVLRMDIIRHIRENPAEIIVAFLISVFAGLVVYWIPNKRSQV